MSASSSPPSARRCRNNDGPCHRVSQALWFTAGLTLTMVGLVALGTLTGAFGAFDDVFASDDRSPDRRRSHSLQNVLHLVHSVGLALASVGGEDPHASPSLDTMSEGLLLQRSAPIYVISLQGVTGADPENEKRFDRFKADWLERCGREHEIEFVLCPGVIDTRKRRGFGCTQAFVNCIGSAMASATMNDYAYAVFVEDDASLLNPSNPLFCSSAFRDELWRETPSDAFAVLFGANHERYSGPADGRFRPVKHSAGKYKARERIIIYTVHHIYSFKNSI